MCWHLYIGNDRLHIVEMNKHIRFEEKSPAEGIQRQLLERLAVYGGKSIGGFMTFQYPDTSSVTNDRPTFPIKRAIGIWRNALASKNRAPLA